MSSYFLSCVARDRRYRTQREIDRMIEERVCSIFCDNNNVVTEHSIKPQRTQKNTRFFSLSLTQIAYPPAFSASPTHKLSLSWDRDSATDLDAYQASDIWQRGLHAHGERHDCIGIYGAFGVPMSCTNIGKQPVQSYGRGGCRSWGGRTIYIYIDISIYLSISLLIYSKKERLMRRNNSIS